jgi:hypothetical protein
LRACVAGLGERLPFLKGAREVAAVGRALAGGEIRARLHHGEHQQQCRAEAARRRCSLS